MGLSYYYEFTAAKTTTAAELEGFLRRVEQLAKSLEFSPTTVLNVPFDTPERRDFSRRLGGSLTIQAEGLKGVAVPAEGQVRDLDPNVGEGRLVPEHGVVLVVTDEHGCETCFGFFKYPKHILDVHGKIIAETECRDIWTFRDFVDTPDPRYRRIVQRFADAGYLNSVKDEYA